MSNFVDETGFITGNLWLFDVIENCRSRVLAPVAFRCNYDLFLSPFANSLQTQTEVCINRSQNNEWIDTHGYHRDYRWWHGIHRRIRAQAPVHKKATSRKTVTVHRHIENESINRINIGLKQQVLFTERQINWGE